MNANADERKQIIFDHRFEGPPNITLGGYLCGVMAVHLDCDAVEVSMRNPTPMGKPLTLDTGTPDLVRMFDGDILLNEARPAELDLELPDPITLEEARKASLRHVTEMPYPNCFGCGSARSDDDGLHLRAGPVPGRDLVAIDWTPRAAAVGAPQGGPVPKEMVWASLECPIARAMQIGDIVGPDELFLLGRMTARVIDLPIVGRPCFHMGWPICRDGRKIRIAGSLHDEKGRTLAETELLFITLKEGVTYESFMGSGA